MAIGDPEPPEEFRAIEFVDWEELYKREDGDVPIIPGLAFPGRWTAIAAPAKQGKSTVVLGLVVAAAKAGFRIVYLDAEMGRIDMLDRVEEWMQLRPDDLANIHYTDLPPKLDTLAGAAMLGIAVETLQPDLVVIDGVNGAVNGEENDDMTWRHLYENAIAPLKSLGVAVITTDNTGHADKTRPRGHSIKLDKADAIVALERTDDGVKLTCNLRRTHSYPHEQHYTVAHAEEDGPPMTVEVVGGSIPEGTKELVAKLDEIDVPIDATRRQARRLLQEAGVKGGKNTTLTAALRHRREHPLATPFSWSPTPGDQISKTPGRPGDQTGGPTKGPPPVGPVPEDPYYGAF